MAPLPYRPNVGIMVLNAEGKVWVGHRSNRNGTEYAGADAFWQMPQGGIDEGEDAQEASLRELYEETGIRSVELVDQTADWIQYNYPPDVPEKLSKKYSGQKQMWFAYRFVGDDSEIRINPPPDGHKAEFDNWKWVEMNQLINLVVDFKKDVYAQVVQQFSKI